MIQRHYPDKLPLITLPSLTIQPLVENAVRHSVESRSEPTCISIQILLSDQHVTLLIQNSVSDNPQGRLTGNGVAIDNIRQRLALFYDDRARFTNGVLDYHYRVKLVIAL